MHEAPTCPLPFVLCGLVSSSCTHSVANDIVGATQLSPLPHPQLFRHLWEYLASIIDRRHEKRWEHAPRRHAVTGAARFRFQPGHGRQEEHKARASHLGASTSTMFLPEADGEGDSFIPKARACTHPSRPADALFFGVSLTTSPILLEHCQDSAAIFHLSAPTHGARGARSSSVPRPEAEVDAYFQPTVCRIWPVWHGESG